MDDYQPLRKCLSSGLLCPKCHKGWKLPPTYVGDWWDCDTCEWSKEPTKEENKRLLRFITEVDYRKKFID